MLAALLHEYIAYRAASDWSPQTVRHGRSTLRRFVAFLIGRGHQRWSSVTGDDCTAFIQYLMERGLVRASRDSAAWMVRGFGQWLTAKGYALSDPTTVMVVLEDDEQPLPPPPLSEQQVAALFDAIPRVSVVDVRNRLHLELLYSCGLRNNEATMLDVRDLDIEARTLFVRHGKGGTARALPLMPGTLVAGSEYLVLRRELLSGPDHGALLLSLWGRRLQPYYMQRWLSAVSRTIGFRMHPHLLRHSIAIHLLRQGADVRHIQHFLGHASLETTKIYLRLVPGHLREDYERAMPVFPISPINPPGIAGHSNEGASNA